MIGNTINLRFDLEKAIQASRELLRLEGKPMGRLRLLKLLYAANRRCIRQTGFPMLMARAVAMDNGPLHSEVLDAINGQYHRWGEFFRNEGDLVCAIGEPGTERLSDFDADALRIEWESFGPYDDATIIVMLHSLPEYIANYRAGTSTTIPLESILDAVGRGSDVATIIDSLLSFQEMQGELSH